MEARGVEVPPELRIRPMKKGLTMAWKLVVGESFSSLRLVGSRAELEVPPMRAEAAAAVLLVAEELREALELARQEACEKFRNQIDMEILDGWHPYRRHHRDCAI